MVDSILRNSETFQKTLDETPGFREKERQLEQEANRRRREQQRQNQQPEPISDAYTRHETRRFHNTRTRYERESYTPRQSEPHEIAGQPEPTEPTVHEPVQMMSHEPKAVIKGSEPGGLFEHYNPNSGLSRVQYLRGLLDIEYEREAAINEVVNNTAETTGRDYGIDPGSQYIYMDPIVSQATGGKGILKEPEPGHIYHTDLIETTEPTAPGLYWDRTYTDEQIGGLTAGQQTWLKTQISTERLNLFSFGPPDKNPYISSDIDTTPNEDGFVTPDVFTAGIAAQMQHIADIEQVEAGMAHKRAFLFDVSSPHMVSMGLDTTQQSDNLWLQATVKQHEADIWADTASDWHDRADRWSIWPDKSHWFDQEDFDTLQEDSNQAQHQINVDKSNLGFAVRWFFDEKELTGLHDEFETRLADEAKYNLGLLAIQSELEAKTLTAADQSLTVTVHTILEAHDEEGFRPDLTHEELYQILNDPAQAAADATERAAVFRYVYDNFDHDTYPDEIEKLNSYLNRQTISASTQYDTDFSSFNIILDDYNTHQFEASLYDLDVSITHATTAHWRAYQASLDALDIERSILAVHESGDERFETDEDLSVLNIHRQTVTQTGNVLDVLKTARNTITIDNFPEVLRQLNLDLAALQNPEHETIVASYGNLIGDYEVYEKRVAGDQLWDSIILTSVHANVALDQSIIGAPDRQAFFIGGTDQLLTYGDSGYTYEQLQWLADTPRASAEHLLFTVDTLAAAHARLDPESDTWYDDYNKIISTTVALQDSGLDERHAQYDAAVDTITTFYEVQFRSPASYLGYQVNDPRDIVGVVLLGDKITSAVRSETGKGNRETYMPMLEELDGDYKLSLFDDKIWAVPEGMADYWYLDKSLYNSFGVRGAVTAHDRLRYSKTVTIQLEGHDVPFQLEGVVPLGVPQSDTEHDFLKELLKSDEDNVLGYWHGEPFAVSLQQEDNFNIARYLYDSYSQYHNIESILITQPYTPVSIEHVMESDYTPKGEYTGTRGLYEAGHIPIIQIDDAITIELAQPAGQFEGYDYSLYEDTKPEGDWGLIKYKDETFWIPSTAYVTVTSSGDTVIAERDLEWEIEYEKALFSGYVGRTNQIDPYYVQTPNVTIGTGYYDLFIHDDKAGLNITIGRPNKGIYIDTEPLDYTNVELSWIYTGHVERFGLNPYIGETGRIREFEGHIGVLTLDLLSRIHPMELYKLDERFNYDYGGFARDTQRYVVEPKLSDYRLGSMGGPLPVLPETWLGEGKYVQFVRELHTRAVEAGTLPPYGTSILDYENYRLINEGMAYTYVRRKWYYDERTNYTVLSTVLDPTQANVHWRPITQITETEAAGRWGLLYTENEPTSLWHVTDPSSGRGIRVDPDSDHWRARSRRRIESQLFEMNVFELQWEPIAGGSPRAFHPHLLLQYKYGIEEKEYGVWLGKEGSGIHLYDMTFSGDHHSMRLWYRMENIVGLIIGRTEAEVAQDAAEFKRLSKQLQGIGDRMHQANIMASGGHAQLGFQGASEDAIFRAVTGYSQDTSDEWHDASNINTYHGGIYRDARVFSHFESRYYEAHQYLQVYSGPGSSVVNLLADTSDGISGLFGGNAIENIYANPPPTADVQTALLRPGVRFEPLTVADIKEIQQITDTAVDSTSEYAGPLYPGWAIGKHTLLAAGTGPRPSYTITVIDKEGHGWIEYNFPDTTPFGSGLGNLFHDSGLGDWAIDDMTIDARQPHIVITNPETGAVSAFSLHPLTVTAPDNTNTGFIGPLQPDPTTSPGDIQYIPTKPLGGDSAEYKSINDYNQIVQERYDKIMQQIKEGQNRIFEDFNRGSDTSHLSIDEETHMVTITNPRYGGSVSVHPLTWPTDSWDREWAKFGVHVDMHWSWSSNANMEAIDELETFHTHPSGALLRFGDKVGTSIRAMLAAGTSTIFVSTASLVFDLDDIIKRGEAPSYYPADLTWDSIAKVVPEDAGAKFAEWDVVGGVVGTVQNPQGWAVVDDIKSNIDTMGVIPTIGSIFVSVIDITGIPRRSPIIVAREFAQIARNTIQITPVPKTIQGEILDPRTGKPVVTGDMTEKLGYIVSFHAGWTDTRGITLFTYNAPLGTASFSDAIADVGDAIKGKFSISNPSASSVSTSASIMNTFSEIKHRTVTATHGLAEIGFALLDIEIGRPSVNRFKDVWAAGWQNTMPEGGRQGAFGSTPSPLLGYITRKDVLAHAVEMGYISDPEGAAGLHEIAKVAFQFRDMDEKFKASLDYKTGAISSLKDEERDAAFRFFSTLRDSKGRLVFPGGTSGAQIQFGYDIIIPTDPDRKFSQQSGDFDPHIDRDLQEQAAKDLAKILSDAKGRDFRAEGNTIYLYGSNDPDYRGAGTYPGESFDNPQGKKIKIVDFLDPEDIAKEEKNYYWMDPDRMVAGWKSDDEGITGPLGERHQSHVHQLSRKITTAITTRIGTGAEKGGYVAPGLTIGPPSWRAKDLFGAAIHIGNTVKDYERQLGRVTKFSPKWFRLKKNIKENTASWKRVTRWAETRLLAAEYYDSGGRHRVIGYPSDKSLPIFGNKMDMAGIRTQEHWDAFLYAQTGAFLENITVFEYLAKMAGGKLTVKGYDGKLYEYEYKGPGKATSSVSRDQLDVFGGYYAPFDDITKATGAADSAGTGRKFTERDLRKMMGATDAEIDSVYAGGVKGRGMVGARQNILEDVELIFMRNMPRVVIAQAMAFGNAELSPVQMVNIMVGGSPPDTSTAAQNILTDDKTDAADAIQKNMKDMVDDLKANMPEEAGAALKDVQAKNTDDVIKAVLEEDQKEQIKEEVANLARPEADVVDDIMHGEQMNVDELIEEKDITHLTPDDVQKLFEREPKTAEMFDEMNNRDNTDDAGQSDWDLIAEMETEIVDKEIRLEEHLKLLKEDIEKELKIKQEHGHRPMSYAMKESIENLQFSKQVMDESRQPMSYAMKESIEYLNLNKEAELRFEKQIKEARIEMLKQIKEQFVISKLNVVYSGQWGRITPSRGMFVEIGIATSNMLLPKAESGYGYDSPVYNTTINVDSPYTQRITTPGTDEYDTYVDRSIDMDMNVNMEYPQQYIGYTGTGYSVSDITIDIEPQPASDIFEYPTKEETIETYSQPKDAQTIVKYPYTGGGRGGATLKMPDIPNIPYITSSSHTTPDMPYTTGTSYTTSDIPYTTPNIPNISYTTGRSYRTPDTPYTTTDIPYTTTDIPYTTTDIPYTTTDIPYTTTDIPYTTTDIPYTTTDIPYTTTDIPYTTTDIPYTTTDIPYTEPPYKEPPYIPPPDIPYTPPPYKEPPYKEPPYTPPPYIPPPFIPPPYTEPPYKEPPYTPPPGIILIPPPPIPYETDYPEPEINVPEDPRRPPIIVWPGSRYGTKKKEKKKKKKKLELFLGASSVYTIAGFHMRPEIYRTGTKSPLIKTDVKERKSIESGPYNIGTKPPRIKNTITRKRAKSGPYNISMKPLPGQRQRRKQTTKPRMPNMRINAGMFKNEMKRKKKKTKKGLFGF